ncbi:MAG TPA: phosphate ABC transporter substrate-binding protein PstS family protein [Spirochaetales bacterium]|nr:phosphate ABC transporter substrate-binding protein PstS family protein [Spirochaetales bacterium]
MKKSLAILLLALVAATASAQAKFPWVAKVSDDPDKLLPGVDPAKATGAIVTAGSSTVYPVSEYIAEIFKEDGFTGQVSIDSIGSGAGIERFAKTGETDIANASAPMPASSYEAAKAIGRSPIEFRIGTDALAVVVSKKNTFAKDVTQAELALLFSSAVNWSDVRPSWPKMPVKRYSPGTDSGTFSYFVEHLFKKDKAKLLGAKNLQLSEDDNVLVRGVEADQYAIGYFGFAYYLENRSRLNVLKIDGVEASAATVDAGTYPLARPLFLYSDAKIINEKPQVAAFLTYYLSNVDEALEAVGYFPAPDAEIKAAKRKLLEAMKGRY